ncbi:nucleotide sugar dehydrogenase, partial [Candidatus Pelagibacter bacterium]
MNKDQLLRSKIKSKNITIGVIGLGYVGLELAILIAKKKYNIFGFDKNNQKVKLIKKGKSPINTINSQSLKFLNKKNILHTSDLDKISSCDIIIICLPTPLKKNQLPDMSFLTNCYKSISKYLRKNQMIILESTVYPNATKEIFENKIKKRFIIGKEFNVCFSPERISPGHNRSYSYNQIAKVISGRTASCLENINNFYKNIFKKVHKCESIEIAEFTKLYENAYRAVNIGLVNQIKMICSKMNINVFDVIRAAKTKPFGFMPFHPGPGVGGHCIPVDPLFIVHTANKLNLKSELIKLSCNVNLETTKWIIKKIEKNVIKKSKILILGAAYKKNVDDYRESPSLKIIKNLSKSY